MANTDQQRNAILNHLRANHLLTTTQARSELDVLHPAGRVKELRGLGYLIATHWDTVETQPGKRHRVARYVLLPGKESRQ